jgi:adenylate kinase
MNLVILGPQGSGKGTQAELLTEKYGFTHVETGEILRNIAETDHPWGKKIKDMMLRGVLVSDDILMAVLKQSLEKPAKNGFLLDGTPRNLAQYQVVINIFASYNQTIDRMILIDISMQETINRLASRRTCKICGKVYNLVTEPPLAENQCECGGILVQRDDDTPESIKKRLETFWESTTKVIDVAKRGGFLIEVNGERPIMDIHDEIVKRLGL